MWSLMRRIDLRPRVVVRSIKEREGADEQRTQDEGQCLGETLDVVAVLQAMAKLTLGVSVWWKKTKI